LNRIDVIKDIVPINVQLAPTPLLLHDIDMKLINDLWSFHRVLTDNQTSGRFRHWIISEISTPIKSILSVDDETISLLASIKKIQRYSIPPLSQYQLNYLQFYLSEGTKTVFVQMSTSGSKNILRNLQIRIADMNIYGGEPISPIKLNNHLQENFHTSKYVNEHLTTNQFSSFNRPEILDMIVNRHKLLHLASWGIDYQFKDVMSYLNTVFKKYRIQGFTRNVYQMFTSGYDRTYSIYRSEIEDLKNSIVHLQVTIENMLVKDDDKTEDKPHNHFNKKDVYNILKELLEIECRRYGIIVK
jgi:hypothetical protein